LLTSCRQNTNYDTGSLYKELINRKIDVIDSLPMKSGNEFLDSTAKNKFFSKNLKIVVIIDGYCSFCFKQLKTWKDSILTLNTFDKYNIPVLFYVHSNNYLPFNSYIKSINFEYPIIYDTTNCIASKNKIPDDNILNTFLLDNDTIRLIGNPVLRPKMKHIYREYINHHCHQY
jgi:hypothetical protein